MYLVTWMKAKGAFLVARQMLANTAEEAARLRDEKRKEDRVSQVRIWRAHNG